jgi:hypothetical protein
MVIRRNKIDKPKTTEAVGNNIGDDFNEFLHKEKPEIFEKLPARKAPLTIDDIGQLIIDYIKKIEKIEAKKRHFK